MKQRISKNQPGHFQAIPSYEGSRFANTLESVQIQGCLRDLSCELLVKQVFVNHSADNIEVVYTFPLPYGAVLLDFTARIGDRVHRGTVTPKEIAEIQYEQSIAGGYAAMMLEKSDEDILTINLGNLLPGEQAILSYQYAHLLVWRQNTVKFRLPTTIAPRYGKPLAAGFQPHQIPVIDILAENRFSLKLSVEGLLHDAMLESPSHSIAILRKADNTEITLTERQAFMDRDFVLDLKRQTGSKPAGMMQWDAVAQCNIAVASFCPDIPYEDIPGICIKIVVDCSGSMGGNSIHQAKAGLLIILDHLRDTDTFNVVCFGDHHESFFPNCVAANGRSLRYARQAIDKLNAEMGGTEIGAALDFAYQLRDTGERPSLILLITDGQVYNYRETISHAVLSGHSVYTIGVGASVAEYFLRAVADKTGGACELAAPRENMPEVISRQFQRMVRIRAIKADLVWPENPLWQSPVQLAPLFAGDTLHVFAGLSAKAQGKAELTMYLDDGREIRQAVYFDESNRLWPVLPRVAAAKRIEEMDVHNRAFAERLAVDYRLLGKYTNYLIIDSGENAPKALITPILVQTPQMLAAGWGGMGNIMVLDQSGNYSLDGMGPLELCCSWPDETPGYYNLPEIQLALDSSVISSRKQTTIALVLAADSQWLPVFLDKMLPALDKSIQEIYHELTGLKQWTHREVAAAMLFEMTNELDIGNINESLKAEFDHIKNQHALLDYIHAILLEDDDQGLRWAIMQLPIKEMT